MYKIINKDNMISKNTVSNSYIYKYIGIIKKLDDIKNLKLNYKKIIVNISGKFYLFIANTNDFTDDDIKNIYNKQQIYINVKGNKVSYDFLNDYRKLKKKGSYFILDKKNLFKESESKVIKILNNIFIGKCLDIGCGNLLYKDIFNRKNVDYLGIDIHKIDNGLKIRETTFEAFKSNEKFDIIFFFRSINHFSDTLGVLNKAYSLLNKNGKIFIVENEAFGEIKFINQIFEGKKSDFEHFFNYTLEEFKKLVKKDYFNIIDEEGVNSNKANQWYIILEKNNK